MIFELLCECIGTALLLIIILSSSRPAEIAIGLLIIMYMFGNANSGHFNSTISIMSYVKGDIPVEKCLGYVCAQFIGIIIAMIWYKHGKHRL